MLALLQLLAAEDAATEFQVQGLELDWVCVTWDADLRPKQTARDDPV
jgi:hypothetical protein